MRRVLAGLLGIILVAATAVTVDAIGYRRWFAHFKRFAGQLALSPSAWDGKPRERSDDPGAYVMQFDLPPSKFVYYTAKPVTAVGFEPPWYVWTYHLCASHQAVWERCEAFYATKAARSAGIYRRVPCQILFYRKGIAAGCADTEIIPPPPE